MRLDECVSRGEFTPKIVDGLVVGSLLGLFEDLLMTIPPVVLIHIPLDGSRGSVAFACRLSN
jgi:hypothetical protein